MANEVSGFHLQVSLDIGEFFGIPREDLTRFFPEDTNFDSKFTRVDWEPFAAMTSYTCNQIGEREELIPLGQKYTYERIGTRFTHLMTQFGGGWDRVLWATKHFFTPRLIRGYDFEYQKLGHNHFRLISHIPDDFVGCEAYFWLFTGIWSGGNKISNLKHQILRIDVTPHGADGEILFAERNVRSKTFFNRHSSQVKTWRELKKSNTEQAALTRQLQQETRNLKAAFDAVSDAVLVLKGNEVEDENAEGYNLRDSLPTHPSQGDWIERGAKMYQLRRVVPLENESMGTRLITLEDRTREYQLQQELKNIPDREQKNAGQQIEDALGKELHALMKDLQDFRQQIPDHPAKPIIDHLAALALHCREHARGLVGQDLITFDSSEALLNALEEMAGEYREVFHFKVVIQGRVFPDLDCGTKRGDLYLILKEAVRNAYRHSGGDRVILSLNGNHLEVEDTGSGLHNREVTDASGIGCQSMKSRASALGFEMEMLPTPRNGWVFRTTEQEISTTDRH